MLYYVLLYESVRLAHMKTILTAQRKGKTMNLIHAVVEQNIIITNGFSITFLK